MSKDEVLRMALDAGAFWELSETPEKDVAFLMRFAERAAAAERERMEFDGIHTCHVECPRPACVAGRDARAKAAKAERERCILILETLHNGAGGIHNYFKYAAETLKVSGGER
jgi:hypothetical protein